jgi:hypothetical protein
MSNAEEKIIAFLRANGPSATWTMRAAGMGDCWRLRSILRSMQSDGLVVLHPRYTSANNLVWCLPEEGA